MKKRNYISCLIFMMPVMLAAQDTLTLQQAVAAALEKNYSIIIARNDSEIAANNNTLGNAGFLPVISSDVTKTTNYNTLKQVYYSGLVREGKDVKADLLNAKVLMNWTLFDGFGMFIAKEKLNDLEKIGEVQMKLTIENTLAKVINTYYAIVQQEKLIALYRDAMSLSEERMALAEKKVLLGAGSELSMLQSKVDRNADSARLLQQISLQNQTKADLNNLTGQEPAALFAVQKEIPLKEKIQYADILAKVTAQNPEILIAQLNYDMAEQSIKQTRSVLYPNINAFGGYNFSKQETSVGYMIYGKTNAPTYGLTATFTIFDGMTRSLAVQNAKIQYRSAEASFKQKELNITTLLYKIYCDYSAASELLSLESSNLQVAKQNLDIAVEKYKLGMISDIELRATQQKMLDAENDLLTAQYRAKQDEIEMLRLSGELMNEIVK